MQWLVVIIGLICLLPKVELCYVDVLPSVAKPKNEYWEEKCKTVPGYFGEMVLEAATKAHKKCYEQTIVKPWMVTGSMESVAEAMCRMMFKRRKCDESFFEGVKPCLQDGEMEKIYQSVFEIHAKQDNFRCNGSNISWETAFLGSNAYESMIFNQERLMECHNRGHCAEISEGLLAYARGGSPDSFKSLYCSMLIEDALCIKGLFNYSGNDKAEKLSQEYLEFTKELCSSYQGNGSNGNVTHGNGSNGNGTNGNGSNRNGSNGNGSNRNGSNGNGSNRNGTHGNGSNGNVTHMNGSNGNGSNANGRNANESSVYENSINGGNGNGMNGNDNNGNESNVNGKNGKVSNGNEGTGNGSAKTMANYIVIAWLPLLAIAKWV